MAEVVAENEETQTAPPVRRRWRLDEWALLGAALGPLACQALARWHWSFDMFCHFRQPAFFAALLGLGLAALRRRKRAWGWLALALVLGWPYARWSIVDAVPVAPRDDQAPRLRVLSSNVLYHNDNHQRLLDLVRAESPDLVGLVEVSASWRTSLKALATDYPYALIVPDEDGATGLALLSKRPFLDGPEWLQPTPSGWPLLRATVEFDDRPLAIWVVHSSNPLRRGEPGPGHPEFAAIAKLVKAGPPTALVAGDLNTTEESPYFHDLLKGAGLRDSRIGFGRQGSWPHYLPTRLALDHALVTQDLAVVDRRLGPEIGSDHMPVLLEIAPAKARDSGPPSSVSKVGGAN